MPTVTNNEEKTEWLQSGPKKALLETGSSLIPVIMGKSFLVFNYFDESKEDGPLYLL